MATIQNELPKWVAVFLWVAAQGVLFGYYFHQFYSSSAFYYTRVIIWLGLPCAKAAAACLNFNCMLILLPVCRNLLSFVRAISSRICLRSIRRLLDQNIEFHKLCAYAICLWTTVHTVAHLYNGEAYVTAQSTAVPRSNTTTYPSAYELSTLGGPGGSSQQGCVGRNDSRWLNPVCRTDGITILEVVQLYPVISGVVITVVLVTIVASATEFIRRSYFEIFWVTHHLFIVFFAFLFSHGFLGVVRELSNPEQHNVTYCAGFSIDSWGDGKTCPLPEFVSNTPKTWMWIVGPVFIYLIERLIRLVRQCQPAYITKVVKHPSRVIEVQMRKKGFKMEAGQYIFLNCSSVSRLEWHPFTLTSAPAEDYFSVHIRVVGDWTEAFAKALHTDEKEFQEAYKLPRVAVDGPFGTASEDWEDYDVDVFVGAGIGVTPFASILKHIWYVYKDKMNTGRLKKVYFFWICPDTSSFEWFTDLLSHLEQQMVEAGCVNFLEYNIYLTRGWDTNQARNIALNEEEERDAVTGLAQKTFYGRPNWDSIFAKMRDKHARTRVGVFFCGPAVLSDQLHTMCNKYSSDVVGDVHFVYNKENF